MTGRHRGALLPIPRTAALLLRHHRRAAGQGRPGEPASTGATLSRPPSRPAQLIATGPGPGDQDGPISPNSAGTAAFLLLGWQIVRVGLEEQLHKQRVHGVLPRLSKPAGYDLKSGKLTA